jgi:hypothetical protein
VDGHCTACFFAGGQLSGAGALSAGQSGYSSTCPSMPAGASVLVSFAWQDICNTNGGSQTTAAISLYTTLAPGTSCAPNSACSLYTTNSANWNDGCVQSFHAGKSPLSNTANVPAGGAANVSASISMDYCSGGGPLTSCSLAGVNSVTFKVQ